jgi:transglutaminase-like putative cysteine protease
MVSCAGWCWSRFWSLGIVLALACGNSMRAEDKPAADKPAVRTFQFNYAATLKEVPEGAKVRVWLPVPPANDAQAVKALEAKLPAKGETTTEPKYGNKILYFQTTGPADGNISFQAPYLITRKEVHGLPGTSRTSPAAKLSPEQRKFYLTADKLVPVGGKPAELLKELKLEGKPIDVARMLYERVDEHMKYDKSRPGYGTGDANWACDSKFGNCTDFHSLFISFARTKSLPARFEMGFPLPPERGEGKVAGYHCWAEFFVDNVGWVPVDISEADKFPDMKEYYFGNLTADRVTFSMGRDIDLVPKQEGPALNFFVYPYVEVDGKLWPKEKTELQFSYADQK